MYYYKHSDNCSDMLPYKMQNISDYNYSYIVHGSFLHIRFDK